MLTIKICHRLVRRNKTLQWSLTSVELKQESVTFWKLDSPIADINHETFEDLNRYDLAEVKWYLESCIRAASQVGQRLRLRKLVHIGEISKVGGGGA